MAGGKSSDIRPHEMSLLKRIAYLEMRGAGSQAKEIYQDLTSAPARKVGGILISNESSGDRSLLTLAADLKESVVPPRRKKAVAS